MELLVVTAIFSLTMLVGTGVFVVAQKTQRLASITQRLHGDTRYTLEAMAREVKFRTVDYSCYRADVTDCFPVAWLSEPGFSVDLEVGAGRTTLLALRDAAGNRKMYRVFPPTGTTTQKLQVCAIESDDDPDRCTLLSNWDVVTPEGVEADRATFYVFPFRDPFTQCESPGGGADPFGANAVNECTGSSPYLEDEQPRVTIVLQTRQSGATVTPQRLASQTTISSRLYLR